MNIYLAGETTIGDTSSDVCSDVFKILRTSVVVAKGSIIVQLVQCRITTHRR